MTWVKIAPGVEATYDGYFTYVMTRVQGLKNRWDVTRVRAGTADTIAHTLPLGKCRRAVRESAKPRAPWL